MNSNIDITGIDKVELLRELHKRQITAGFYGFTFGIGPAFDDDKAREVVSKGYIDYFCGRAMKVDISGNEACPRLYDRDAGTGVFAEVVATFKQ